MLVVVVDVELGEDKAQGEFWVRWTHGGFHPRYPQEEPLWAGIGVGSWESCWSPGRAEVHKVLPKPPGCSSPCWAVHKAEHPPGVVGGGGEGTGAAQDSGEWAEGRMSSSTQRSSWWALTEGRAAEEQHPASVCPRCASTARAELQATISHRTLCFFSFPWCCSSCFGDGFLPTADVSPPGWAGADWGGLVCFCRVAHQDKVLL